MWFTSHFTSRVSFTMHSLHHCRAWLHHMTAELWQMTCPCHRVFINDVKSEYNHHSRVRMWWWVTVSSAGAGWRLSAGTGPGLLLVTLSVSTLVSGHLTSPTLSSRHVRRVLQCLEFRGQNPEMATTSTFSLLNTTFTLSRIYYDTIIVNGCWNNWHL